MSKTEKEQYFDYLNRTLRTGEDVYIYGTAIKGTPIHFSLSWIDGQMDEYGSHLSLRLVIKDLNEKKELDHLPYIQSIKYEHSLEQSWNRLYAQRDFYPIYCQLDIPIKYVSKIPFGTKTAQLLYSKEGI